MSASGALRLYLIADTGLVPDERLPTVVAAALRGGVSCVQLRAKDHSTAAQVALARELRRACARAGVPFIVNDRLDVALAAGADGVHVGHLGQEDLDPADARRLLGPERWIGVSVAGAAEAAAAAARGASYLSAGPMFATATKRDAGPAAGTALLAEVRRATDLPLVAIGGIRPEHAAALYAAGADGLAVGAAILLAEDPAQAAGAFAAAVA